MNKQALSALGAAFLLISCDGRTSGESADMPGNANAPSSAEEDRPDGGSENRALYPGSQPAGDPDRFATSDSIDRVVAWYRDPSRRSSEFMYASTEEQDDGFLVMGTAGEEGTPFALKLTRRPDGGTETRMLPYDPKKGLKQ